MLCIHSPPSDDRDIPATQEPRQFLLRHHSLDTQHDAVWYDGGLVTLPTNLHRIHKRRTDGGSLNRYNAVVTPRENGGLGCTESNTPCCPQCKRYNANEKQRKKCAHPIRVCIGPCVSMSIDSQFVVLVAAAPAV
jgi:hypothetical protein